MCNKFSDNTDTQIVITQINVFIFKIVKRHFLKALLSTIVF